jgi:hypothetical protein
MAAPMDAPASHQRAHNEHSKAIKKGRVYRELLPDNVELWTPAAPLFWFWGVGGWVKQSLRQQVIPSLPRRLGCDAASGPDYLRGYGDWLSCAMGAKVGQEGKRGQILAALLHLYQRQQAA